MYGYIYCNLLHMDNVVGNVCEVPLMDVIYLIAETCVLLYLMLLVDEQRLVKTRSLVDRIVLTCIVCYLMLRIVITMLVIIMLVIR